MDKAYIVANEQQEREVLEKLYAQGMEWGSHDYKWTPSKARSVFFWHGFPYTLFTHSSNHEIRYGYINNTDKTEIVFDGRKEEQMREKYVVSQEFMNELKEWKNNLVTYDEPGFFFDGEVIENLPDAVNVWWCDDVPDEENNNRLIAIIRWVNGEDVFEVEKPKKWVVRSKSPSNLGKYWYVF